MHQSTLLTSLKLCIVVLRDSPGPGPELYPDLDPGLDLDHTEAKAGHKLQEWSVECLHRQAILLCCCQIAQVAHPIRIALLGNLGDLGSNKEI